MYGLVFGGTFLNSLSNVLPLSGRVFLVTGHEVLANAVESFKLSFIRQVVNALGAETDEGCDFIVR